MISWGNFQCRKGRDTDALCRAAGAVSGTAGVYRSDSGGAGRAVSAQDLPRPYPDPSEGQSLGTNRHLAPGDLPGGERI